MRLVTALRAFRNTVALAIVAATVSCSDSPSSPQDPSGPQPGEATVAVSSNPLGAAALVLRITGGAVEDVRAGSGTAFWQPTADGALAVVVLGEAANGGFATVRVSDLRALSNYRITVVEASDTANEPLSPGAIPVRLLW